MYEFAPEKEKEEHIWRRKRSKIFGGTWSVKGITE